MKSIADTLELLNELQILYEECYLLGSLFVPVPVNFDAGNFQLSSLLSS